MWEHVLPFTAWIVAMQLPVASAALRYAIQAGAGLGLLLWMRPWRFYGRPEIRHMPAAARVGAAVALLWILPETAWFSRFPRMQDLYLLWGVRPLGVITGVPVHSPYSPEVCGWGLTLVRLAGSALVIAVIEEFFWRGFILRWFVQREFLAVDPQALPWKPMLLMVLLFGLEHDRWLMGCVAGAAYGLLYARTRDLWAAAVAHVTTNLLLGLYVVAFGEYRFW